MYYASKIDSLKDIFGAKDIHLNEKQLVLGENHYPIIDDVIVLLDPYQYTPFLQKRLKALNRNSSSKYGDFDKNIQYTFGEEWKTYPNILPEHLNEFQKYFDLTDLTQLSNLRVCDLGCGIGRWSYFLHERSCARLLRERADLHAPAEKTSLVFASVPRWYPRFVSCGDWKPGPQIWPPARAASSCSASPAVGAATATPRPSPIWRGSRRRPQPAGFPARRWRCWP